MAAILKLQENPAVELILKQKAEYTENISDLDYKTLEISLHIW